MLNYKIPFNKPYVSRRQIENIYSVISNRKFCGDGPFTKKCHSLLEDFYNSKVLLTTSCTHALEMTALLCDISPGDEVIMPSYTFVSTANAFVNFGAKIIFVDIDPHSMNIDHNLLNQAITKKTKAIVVVHYAGVSCEMDKITKIAKQNNIFLIEDAAQAYGSEFDGKKLGTFGDFGCISFHETKNIHCGEGGALIINNKEFFSLAEVIREKGTNRSQFFRGEVDKYRWISKGSSYLPSELNAAFLFEQLKKASIIEEKRLKLWNRYYKNLSDIDNISIHSVPKNKKHNGHMFYIKTKDLEERSKLIEFLERNHINTVFHYIPLHESKKCSFFYRFAGDDKFTTIESQRILRLPLYFDLKLQEVDYISRKIIEFYD